jgi:hypothetical protein
LGRLLNLSTLPQPQRFGFLRGMAAVFQAAPGAAIAASGIRVDMPGALEMFEQGFDHFGRGAQFEGQLVGFERTAGADFVQEFFEHFLPCFLSANLANFR